MTVIYTESEAIDNARANLYRWGVAPALLATADKARLIELVKMRQRSFEPEGLMHGICVALLRDLGRPCP